MIGQGGQTFYWLIFKLTEPTFIPEEERKFYRWVKEIERPKL
jgi:hypothetical protein